MQSGSKGPTDSMKKEMTGVTTSARSEMTKFGCIWGVGRLRGLRRVSVGKHWGDIFFEVG